MNQELQRAEKLSPDQHSSSDPVNNWVSFLSLDTSSEEFKLRCLARHYLRTYPSFNSRYEALLSYDKRQGTAALNCLKKWIKLEQAYFSYLATQSGTQPTQGDFYRFLQTPPSSTQSVFYKPAYTPTPWWSMTPWLKEVQAA